MDIWYILFYRKSSYFKFPIFDKKVRIIFTPNNEFFTNLMENVSHNLELDEAIGVENGQKMKDMLVNDIKYHDRNLPTIPTEQSFGNIIHNALQCCVTHYSVVFYWLFVRYGGEIRFIRFLFESLLQILSDIKKALK